MKIFKRFLMGLGTVLLLALSLQLVAPKAVHAVVSTLVTVANTPSNPVYTTDAVNSENLLQVTCYMDNSARGGIISNTNCYTVPAGQRALVEQVDGICSTSTGNLVQNLTLVINSSDTLHEIPLVLEDGGNSGLTFFAFSVPTHFYSDVNATFKTYIDSDGPSNYATDPVCYVNVSGRLMPAN